LEFEQAFQKIQFEKGFGKDLEKQFPNGSWKTVNGAKVFINNGKVIAGLDNFNGTIDDFFKEKKGKEGKKGKEERLKSADKMFENFAFEDEKN